MAEELLGEWVESRGAAHRVHIISKGVTIADLAVSLKRLRTERLAGYKIQDINDTQMLQDALAAKQAGTVEQVGASVMSDFAEARQMLQAGVGLVQVPYNALDLRADQGDFWAQAKAKGISVFARGPFLQGLLLRQPDALPAHMQHTKAYLEAFIAVAHKFGLSQLQAALLFALHAQPQVRVVFGVKTLAQLQEIIAAAQTPLPEGFIDTVRALPVPPKEVTNPALWKLQPK